MNYIEVSGNHRAQGTCSDNECPCGVPGASIPRGTGYMYVSKGVVDFRRDCLTEKEARAKIDAMSKRLNSVIMAGSGVFAPVLMCERGARQRGLDLETAAADAKLWWSTGRVPLRVTPLAGALSAAAAAGTTTVAATPGTVRSFSDPGSGGGPGRKSWWQFWK